MAQQKQKQRQNKKQKGQGARQGQKKQPNKPAPNPLTAPPTPQSVRKESRAATQTKFRPLERAIGAEVRASKQRTRQEGNWWQNYLDEVSAADASNKAAYDQAAATTQGFITQAGATDAAQTSSLQAEAAKNAELRGAAPGTELAGREAAAGAQRNYLSAATGGKTAQVGAAQHAYLQDKRRIGVGQSIASRKEEQRRTRGFEKDRRDTRGERGAYRVATEGEKQKDARDYLIQRRAFPLEKQKLKQEAEEGKADQTLAEREEARRRREEKRKQNEYKHPNDGGGLTPSEKQGKKESWNNAKSTARTLFERGRGYKKPSGETVYGPKWGWRSWAELVAAVAKEAEVPPAMARRAVERIRKHEQSQGGPSAGKPQGPTINPSA